MIHNSSNRFTFSFLQRLHNFISLFSRLRKSTYDRLRVLQNGVLGDVMKQVMSRDPIAPILVDHHYVAVDRRLATIIDVVQDCMTSRGGRKVLIDDGTT